MEFIAFLFILATVAFDVVIFMEIEKILDNTFEIGNGISKINRYLFRLNRKGKK